LTNIKNEESKKENELKMNQDFDFFKTTMQKTRMTDFHLGCLDGSVFIDFNHTEENRI